MSGRKADGREGRLFQIGDMARLFHLSVSSIRHYEALGLLTPERVDPATGYRYYGPRQFEVFNTVRYLRALNLPLDEIADFLQDRDVDRIEEKLRAQKAAVAEKQRELARVERKIDARLRQLQEAQTAKLGAVELARIPACRLFWVDEPLTARNYHELELSAGKLAAAQAEALVFLGKVGFSISAQRLARRQYDRYDGAFLLLDEADRVDGPVLCLPETHCARVRFRGHHLQSPAQYRALDDFIRGRGLRIGGFSREITMIDQGFTSDPEKFVTEISIPVEDA